ncbi:MAG: hypothetical protein C0P74_013380 [Gammaproteobacteria bacterium]|nr:hypothetical protein [Gammaproteobacteria bacterium]
MTCSRWIFSALAAIALSGPAVADELKMVPAPEAVRDRPTRGMSMEKVEATYGVPTRRLPPVGQPPITRWEYPGFVVYFEHNLVIHTVIEG